jgi:aminoglycoside 3-N-acetyltransferase
VEDAAVTTGTQRARLAPQTRPALADDLRGLGVRPGDTLLVHSALSSLGFVVGATVAVVHALLDAVGPAGTLVVPAQTARQNRDPSRYDDPRVTPNWWPTIREHLPAYEPDVTPSEGVGAIAEQIRVWPGAVRSAHPQTSFAALGPLAGELMAGHALESPLGEASPLARLEEAGGRVLLLGVGYDRCTCFHLAEYRLPDPPMVTNGCAVLTDEGRQWLSYVGVALSAGDFAALGADFEAASPEVATGPVGAATAKLFPVRSATAFAREWLLSHRRGSVPR